MEKQTVKLKQDIKQVINVCLLTATETLSLDQLSNVFDEPIDLQTVEEVILQLTQEYAQGGMELLKLSTGYRIRSQLKFQPYLNKLYQIKPPKYSRALLETVAIIAYHQPITRGEIEEIRGVAINSLIMQTLLERGWIEIIGYKQIPGKPELIATTTKFLDDLDIKSLSELPKLPEIDLVSLQNSNNLKDEL